MQCSPNGRIYSVFVSHDVSVIMRGCIVHVIQDQPAKMQLVQRDDMVENLAMAAFHPALRGPILPWRLNTRSLGLHRPVAFRNAITLASNIESRSRITYRYGVAS